MDQSSALLTIHSKEEQEFLTNWLQKYESVNPFVWIGMKYTDKVYKWMDGTDNNFTNWADDAVKDGLDPCVQMSLVNASMSKWYDQSCKMTGLVVCQKRQEFNLNVVKELIEGLTKDKENQQNKLISQEKIIQNHQEQINHLIPIDLLYTQFPNQSSPQQLWPNMK